jgi:hyaluronan synthase
MEIKEKPQQIVLSSRMNKKLKFVRYLIIAGLGAIVTLKLYLVLFVIDPIIGLYGFLATSLIFMAFLFAYTKYKDPSTIPDARSYTQPFVSVIIPAKNESEMIREVVDACLASSYQKTEIILVNDGSTDNTGRVMDSLQRENPRRVKVVHLIENLGKRMAIREGMVRANAQGDIIVLVDSDSVVDKTAIENLVRVFDDPEVGAVTGHARAKNADQNTLTRIQDAWYDGQFFIMKGIESSFNTVTCCSGTLSAYRREAIMPCLDSWCNDRFLGAPFKPGDDRHLTSYVLGGSKHYLDSRNKAWKVCYCESALVHTLAPSGFKQFIRQQIRWKKSWVRIFCFAAPFYHKDRSPIAAIFYYLQMTLSLIMPLVVFRSLVMLPLQGEYMDTLAYLGGVLFIGFVYALEFRLRNPHLGNRWIYRIMMTVLSVFILSFLLYYSLLTIRKGSWLTR